MLGFTFLILVMTKISTCVLIDSVVGPDNRRQKRIEIDIQKDVIEQVCSTHTGKNNSGFFMLKNPQ